MTFIDRVSAALESNEGMLSLCFSLNIWLVFDYSNEEIESSSKTKTMEYKAFAQKFYARFKKTIAFCEENKMILNHAFDGDFSVIAHSLIKKIYMQIIGKPVQLSSRAEKMLATLKKYIIDVKEVAFCYGFTKDDDDLLEGLLQIFIYVDDGSELRHDGRIKHMSEKKKYVIFRTYADMEKTKDVGKYCFILEEHNLKPPLIYKNDSGMTILNPHNYSSTEFKNQLSFCFHNSAYKGALMQMIKSMTKLDKEGTKKMLSLLERHDADPEIYAYLAKFAITVKESTGYYNAKMVKKIIEMVNEQYGLSYEPVKYLDFGAGTGTKTEQVRKELRLRNENVFALDKKEFHSVKHDNHYAFNYIFYDGITIPKMDGINLVTILHVLHHLDDVNSIIEQLENTYAEEVLVIVKDHDCYEDNFAKIIDIQHVLHEVVRGDHNAHILDTYKARYTSSSELVMFFTMRGYLNLACPQDDYDDNPTRFNFYAFYKKRI